MSNQRRRSPLELVPPERRTWERSRPLLNWGCLGTLVAVVLFWAAVAALYLWLTT